MPEPSGILEDLRPIVEQVLPVSRAALGAEESLVERGLDSVGMVELLSALEDRFGVSVPPEEILPDNFATLETIASLIARLTAPC
jgi:acyl carrier protein